MRGFFIRSIQQLTVLVVLAQWLHYFPAALQANREHNQVARNDTNRFAALWRYQDFTFQNICSFLDAEIQRELGHFLFPDRPIGNAQFLQFFFAWVVLDNNLA